MLAINAARETPFRSSSMTQRSPSSVAVPGASHPSRDAIASAPPASGARSSRNRDEKKWMWASLIIRRLEVGGWRLEVGGWRLEVGGWRLEVGRGFGPFIAIRS